MSRRALVASAGVLLAAPALVTRARAQGAVAEIGMQSDQPGARVWFDPVGLFIEPGTVVRWHLHASVHTTTAYHPANDRHSLRIPEAAEPWDSGVLVEPDATFEVTLTEEGVYDYYCAPHEAAGMVGRIIVGRPAGPGLEPFDYFERLDPRPDWLPVPAAAQATFPPVEDIMRHRRIAAR